MFVSKTAMFVSKTNIDIIIHVSKLAQTPWCYDGIKITFGACKTTKKYICLHLIKDHTPADSVVIFRWESVHFSNKNWRLYALKIYAAPMQNSAKFSLLSRFSKNPIWPVLFWLASCTLSTKTYNFIEVLSSGTQCRWDSSVSCKCWTGFFEC